MPWWRWWQWLWWLVRPMTGGRCPRRRKMMCRSGDGGCGTENSCLVSRAPIESPAESPAVPPEKNGESSFGLGFFEQAQKQLAERSPYDAEESTAAAVPTLPASFVKFLSKHSDSRKRQKKLHSGVEAKASARAERSRSSNIWGETEEYFREVTLNDVEWLHGAGPFCSLASRKCFLIPILQNGNVSAAADVVKKQIPNVEAKGFNSDLGSVSKAEEVKVVDHSSEADRVGNGVSSQVVRQSMPLRSSLEWLLGSRNKIYLASERPSKKRKLLGGDAGLEKLLVARPVEGNSSLCHICCLGDMNDSLNRLIICSSCEAAVHQKCYGVRDDVDESWLCSWCKHENDAGKLAGSDVNDSSLGPCLLCPRKGGALKPVYKSGGSPEFAHLFCSQWMPEVFIEDIRLMEPIMNVHGIKETRRKLICNVCRMKNGPCVRCSNGACRTSFHPICARASGHRLEIWGRFGCDTVELRGFCSKHSEPQSSGTRNLVDKSVLVDADPSVARFSVPSPPIRHQRLKVTENDVDKAGKPELDNNKLFDNDSQEREIRVARSFDRLPEGYDNGQEVFDKDTGNKNDLEDINPLRSLNFVQILKKLIDRGKVDAKDVASEIGIAPDSLTATLTENSYIPDMHCKIVKWLKNHAHMAALQKNMIKKIKCTVPSKVDVGSTDGIGAASISKSDFLDVPVNSAPSRRITKNNIRIVRDAKVLSSSKDISNDLSRLAQDLRTGQSNGAENSSEVVMGTPVDNGLVADDDKGDQDNAIGDKNPSKDSLSCALDKIMVEPLVSRDTLAVQSTESESMSTKLEKCGMECDQADRAVGHDENDSLASDPKKPNHPVVFELLNAKAVSSCYIHPCIGEDLSKISGECFGLHRSDLSSTKETPSEDAPFNYQKQQSSGLGKVYNIDESNSEQLTNARDVGVLSLFPEDEVEGELIYFQRRLLSNALARKRINDDLICKVAKRLPEEIDAARRRTWDAVLVNQYLSELREMKKQGRKERRFKEAQAVLAAATAAAAASSRMSSLRKDSLDEAVYQESPAKLNAGLRTGVYPQAIPRAKETLPRVAVARASSEKHSDYIQSMANLSKELPKSCDICRRSETILNPLLFCSECKVAVHLDCYRSVKDSTGPWYCELCDDLLQSKFCGTWEKPSFVVDCGLCGETTGAFRKASNGQWLHAFCAEWVLGSTYRRGQVNLVEGMEKVLSNRDVCCICHRKHGVCIKCNYGHCQSTFHPFCARNVGLYMNVKSTSGLLQHKAYCEKHSIEQRAKAETQKHGAEELKTMKQIRVELERLRLLCERIIKREKVKRELIVCSHDVLASKRDTLALSVLVRSPFFQPDISSESATTSLKGNTDGYRSCSEAFQRSDDLTVDSTVSSKRDMKLPIFIDNDQKAVDSPASQPHIVRNPTDRALFSGKKIPHRPSSIVLPDCSDIGDENIKLRKNTETFQKELIMTSDQASVRNQRLPKGYVYVPVGCLPNDKTDGQDAPCEPSDHDDG